MMTTWRYLVRVQHDESKYTLVAITTESPPSPKLIKEVEAEACQEFVAPVALVLHWQQYPDSGDEVS